MAATSDTTTKSFVKSLFDFQFTSLIATRFLRIVYMVWVILLSIMTVVGILAVLSQGGAGILIALFLVVIYFFELIGLRIFMEFLIVFFQIGVALDQGQDQRRQ